MSFCIKCRAHATFKHTVFQGTVAKTVNLCDSCKSSLNVDEHLANIKGAPDHDAKIQAVSTFLDAVQGSSG